MFLGLQWRLVRWRGRGNLPFPARVAPRIANMWSEIGRLDVRHESFQIEQESRGRSRAEQDVERDPHGVARSSTLLTPAHPVHQPPRRLKFRALVSAPSRRRAYLKNLGFAMRLPTDWWGVMFSLVGCSLGNQSASRSERPTGMKSTRRSSPVPSNDQTAMVVPSSPNSNGRPCRLSLRSIVRRRHTVTSTVSIADHWVLRPALAGNWALRIA
jgi:hypothetical protein